MRDDTQRTAAGEADFLRRYLDDSRESLDVMLESPGFRAALTRGEPHPLEPYLRNLVSARRPFEAVLAVEADGRCWPPRRAWRHWRLPPPLLPRRAPRPFLTSGPRTPWWRWRGPSRSDGERAALLVGLLSLERLSTPPRPPRGASACRCWTGTGSRCCGTPAPDGPAERGPPARGRARGRGPEGSATIEAFDAADRRILAAEAPVEDT